MQKRIPGYYWAKYRGNWVMLQWVAFLLPEEDSLLPVRGSWWEIGNENSLSEYAETFFDIVSTEPIKPPAP